LHDQLSFAERNFTFDKNREEGHEGDKAQAADLNQGDDDNLPV
jgi:hypothetical protein